MEEIKIYYESDCHKSYKFPIIISLEAIENSWHDSC